METLGIGVIGALGFVLVTQLIPARTLKSRAAAGFVVAAGIHVFFEIIGWNKYYCKNGAACSA